MEVHDLLAGGHIEVECGLGNDAGVLHERVVLARCALVACARDEVRHAVHARTLLPLLLLPV